MNSLVSIRIILLLESLRIHPPIFGALALSKTIL